MKKMVKGCAMAVAIASMATFVGCSNASKYESMLEEMNEISIELAELMAEKNLEFQVEEFKKMSEDEQKTMLEMTEAALEETKKNTKELKKKIKEAKSPKDMKPASFSGKVRFN